MYIYMYIYLFIYLLFGLINNKMLKSQDGASALHCSCLLATHIHPISTLLSSDFFLFLNVEEYLQEPVTIVHQEMRMTQQFSFWKINASPTRKPKLNETPVECTMQASNMIIIIHHQSQRCFLITWIWTDFLTALCCLFLCTFIIKFQSSCSNHNQISFCCFTEAEQRSTAYAKDDGAQDFSFCTCHYICFIPFWKLSTSPKHLSLAKGSTINICREWLHQWLRNWGRTWGHDMGEVYQRVRSDALRMYL
jgi:hypothetical protein